MANNESPTKVEEENKISPEAEAEDSLSLESLDSILAEEDPEFAQSLLDIGPDNPTEIYNESVELEYTLEEELKRWKEASPKKAKIAKYLPFIPRLSYRVRVFRASLRLTIVKQKEQAIYRVKNAGPLLMAGAKNSALKLKTSLSDGLQAFSKFSTLKKVGFAGLVLVTAAGGFLIYRITTKGLLPPEKEMFISSMEDWAQEKHFYDRSAQMESFYESTRMSQNILLMKKMTVNLRPSSESGPNPMGAFEFYVEGAASEVVVEIKDREPEVEDLFLRTIEDMTFDQVSSGEGKQLLCERLRKEVNKILTKGYVRRIFIKNAIVKP
ncbi:flagellar basal body-associated FliL family protein [Bdellovibrio bacteriovorus]